MQVGFSGVPLRQSPPVTYEPLGSKTAGGCACSTTVVAVELGGAGAGVEDEPQAVRNRATSMVGVFIMELVRDHVAYHRDAAGCRAVAARNAGATCGHDLGSVRIVARRAASLAR